MLTFREAAHTDGETVSDNLKRRAIPACLDGEEPGELVPGTIFWSSSSDLPRIKKSDGTFDTLAAGGTVPTLDPITFFARPDSGATPLTGVTAFDSRELLQCEHITPEDFGAVGDDSANDTPALQAAIAYCIVNKKPLVLTNGKTYRTNGCLQVEAAGGSGFVGLTIRSQAAGHADLGSAKIHATNKLLPALNLQGNIFTRILGVGFVGVNTGFIDSGLGLPVPTVSTWMAAGVSNTQYAPYAAITIDAFAVDPGGGLGYPGGVYGRQAGSQHIEIRDCSIEHFAVGVLNFAPFNNGELITFHKSLIQFCAVAVANCGSQNTAQTAQDLSVAYCHTAMDNRTYGVQSGKAPYVLTGQFVACHRLFNVLTNTGPLHANGMYCEVINSLGCIEGAQQATFTDCTFHFYYSRLYQPAHYGKIGTYLNTFKGCSFDNGLPYINFFGGDTGVITDFDGCWFTSQPYSSIDRMRICHYVEGGRNRVRMRNCVIGAGGPSATGLKGMNEDVDVPDAGGRWEVSQHSRRVRTRGTPSLGEEMVVKQGFPARCVELTASGYHWSGQTLTFTAGVSGEFLVGDYFYWQLSSAAGGGNIDTSPGVSDYIQGSVIAGRITVVAGTAITAVVDGVATEYDQTINPAVVRIAHNDWAPNRVLTATWTTLSTTIVTNTAFDLAVGDFVLAAAGLPAIVRVTAVTDSTHYVLSKNPTVDKVAEPIYCSKLIPLF